MSDKYKIPKKIHFIWVTSDSRPLEIIKPYGSNFFEYKTHFEVPAPVNYFYNIQKILEYYPDWEINIWTRDKSLIPGTVKTLENTKVNIREFGPLLERVGLSDEIVQDVDKFFQNPKFSFGDIIDLYKYAVAYKEGGLITDFNFAAKNYFPEEILQYKEGFMTDQENSFFGVKPNHPLMKLMISEFKIDSSIMEHGSSYYNLFCDEVYKYYDDSNKTFERLHLRPRSLDIIYNQNGYNVNIGIKIGEKSWYKSSSEGAYDLQVEYQKLTMDFLDFITPVVSAGVCLAPEDMDISS